MNASCTILRHHQTRASCAQLDDPIKWKYTLEQSQGKAFFENVLPAIFFESPSILILRSLSVHLYGPWSSVRFVQRMEKE